MVSLNPSKLLFQSSCVLMSVCLLLLLLVTWAFNLTLNDICIIIQISSIAKFCLFSKAILDVLLIYYISKYTARNTTTTTTALNHSKLNYRHSIILNLLANQLDGLQLVLKFCCSFCKYSILNSLHWLESATESRSYTKFLILPTIE
jgi:hypothetical protein